MSAEAEVVSLVKIENENVGVLMRRSTDVAGVCRDIVLKTASVIQGRKYVKVEGWQSIAVAYGCVASSRDVELVTGGVRAIGEVRRMSDGAVLATAEGFVGEDEPIWYGGGLNAKTGKPYERRPEYARRAMAQTRAISRACRSAFAFIVTLIDERLSTTPAEEMDGLATDVSTPPPAGVEKLKQQATAPAASPPKPRLKMQDVPPEPSPYADVDLAPDEVSATRDRPAATHDRTLSFKFGNNKGVPLSALDDDGVSWYRAAVQRDLADPAKAQWARIATLQLANIEAELRFRGLPV